MQCSGRIGILGGTFNPIHAGHLVLAEQAWQQLRLEQVLFVPSAAPPHKAQYSVAPAQARYRMVELAISFNPHFALSDIELRRKGPSYSIITVKQLRKLYPKKKLFFLVGSDFLREFPFWKKIRQLRKLCTFVVARRPGYKIKHLPKDMCTLQVNALDISSTDIRRRLRGKESIRYLVPEQVRSYILRKKLYAS